MSQLEVEQPTPSQGQQLNTSVRKKSEEIDNLVEDVVLPGTSVQDVELRAISFTSQSQRIPKSSNMAIPIFMIVISLIQVWIFYWGGEFQLYLEYQTSRRHEVWRFFTLMFVHISESHLRGNLIPQLIFGMHLEIFHHWKRTAIIYTVGVFGGTLFITYFTPSINSAAGASAGVYALMIAHIGTILLNWDEMNNKYFRLDWPFSYIVVGIGLTLGNEKTSHASHFGGLVTGFLISIIVLKIVVERPWKKMLQKICAIILITLTLVIVIINIAFPSMYTQSEFNADYDESFSNETIDNSSSSEPVCINKNIY